MFRVYYELMNLDQPYARQAFYLLYYHFGPIMLSLTIFYSFTIFLYIPHMGEITLQLSLSFSLVSHNIIPSSSIDIVANCVINFFLIAK